MYQFCFHLCSEDILVFIKGLALLLSFIRIKLPPECWIAGALAVSGYMMSAWGFVYFDFHSKHTVIYMVRYGSSCGHHLVTCAFTHFGN